MSLVALGKRLHDVQAEDDQQHQVSSSRYWTEQTKATPSMSLLPAAQLQTDCSVLEAPCTPPQVALCKLPTPILAATKPWPTKQKRRRVMTPRRREQCRINQARYRAKLKQVKYKKAILSTGGSVDNLSLPPAVVEDTPAVKKPCVRAKTEQRMHQCRVSQARYRIKKRCYEQNLDASVRQLATTVRELKIQRVQMLSAVEATPSEVAAAVWVVHEFFRLVYSRVTSTQNALVQRHFLDSFIAQDLEMAGRTGLHVLETHLHTYKRVFHALELSTTHIRPLTCGGPVTIVQAETILHGYITDQLIQDLFPHLLREPHRQLGDNLRGRRLELPCSWRFHCVDSRIVSIEAHLDLVAGLVCVFGRLEDVDVALQSPRAQLLITL